MGNWIPHLIIDYGEKAGFDSGYGNYTRETTAVDIRKQMYLSSYTSSSFYPWFITNTILAVFYFFVGYELMLFNFHETFQNRAWYVFDVNRFFKNKKIDDCEGCFEMLDIIPVFLFTFYVLRSYALRKMLEQQE